MAESILVSKDFRELICSKLEEVSSEIVSIHKSLHEPDAERFSPEVMIAKIDLAIAAAFAARAGMQLERERALDELDAEEEQRELN